ncbi:hypothetical protein BDR07DRAFT_1404304, partial [Suillus spraguei]
LCFTQESPRGRLQGYIIGKAEGVQTEWHGHITAVSVAPEYRRLSLARNMCQRLKFASDEIYKGYPVDLHECCNNTLVIKMHEVRDGKDGRDDEDAFDMRKCLSRDAAQRSIRSNGRDMIVSAHDVS